MSRFKKLVSNESEFPHIDNVNVYQFDNEFNYERYNYDQMNIQICNVPWDMGEAHIGNRTIGGIGNVVYFESKDARDAWFDAIPDSKCYRFTTKYKELHRDNYIDVPIPFDAIARYNYVRVQYHFFANDDSPVEYETEDGVHDWLWFIREVEFLAPNTTRLHILPDSFQTFIYDLDVTNMVLERGHAPMFAVSADSYLANPVNRSANLLAPDANFADAPNIAKHQSQFIFNTDDVVAVIITTANPVNGAWGSKANGDWVTNAGRHFLMQGKPAYCAFAIDVDSILEFLIGVDSQCPQFVQTIKAICFVSESLMSYEGSFTFCGVVCNLVSAGYEENTLYTIDKDDFGYPAKYADIAKLYTYPYAHLVITDEDGASTEIRIEDTTGTIKLESKIGLVWPWLKISAHLRGIGKTANRNITFHDVYSHNFPTGGSWWEYIYEWDIPTFGVTQNAATQNDYSTHFDRVQTATAGANAYANEIESATASLGDANATADNTVNQAVLQNALNDANATTANTKAQASYYATTMLNGGQADAAYAYTNATTNNQIDYQYASGNLAAFQSGVSGAVSGGLAMAGSGPGAAIGALAGGAIGAIGALMGAQAGVNLTSAQAAATLDQMLDNLYESDVATGRERDAIIAQTNSNNTAAKTFTTASANNSAALQRNNATRDYNAASANATRNLATVNSGITNQIAQAALDAPGEFGDFSDGETAATRPQGIFCNVVTQSDYAIARAGDEFLRYGYRFDGQWEFDGDWNIGKYFTFWKLRDFWIKDISVPDMYIDQIRMLLFEGVTIWSDPAYIGKVSIADNF